MKVIVCMALTFIVSGLSFAGARKTIVHQDVVDEAGCPETLTYYGSCDLSSEHLIDCFSVHGTCFEDLCCGPRRDSRKHLLKK